jgi:hypothetical protein
MASTNEGQCSIAAAGGVNSSRLRIVSVCSAMRSRMRVAVTGPAPGKSWMTSTEQVLSYRAGSFILFLLSSCHDLSHSAVDASSSFEKALGGAS